MKTCKENIQMSLSPIIYGKRKNTVYTMNEEETDFNRILMLEGSFFFPAAQSLSKRCGETFATGKNCVHYSGDAAIII